MCKACHKSFNSIKILTESRFTLHNGHGIPHSFWMVYVDVYKTWMEATYEYDIPNKDMFEVHNMQVKLQRSDMEYAHGVVLGQLRTGDNAPCRIKIKPNYCPPGPLSPELLPTIGQLPTRTISSSKTIHQDQYQHGGEMSWRGVIRIHNEYKTRVFFLHGLHRME